MENKDYVSYEQARKLKELGFDWKCDHYYTNGYINDDPEDTSRVVKFHIDTPYNHNKVIRESACCSAPTLWEAQKWLREERSVDIYVIPRYQNAYEVAAKRLGKRVVDTFFVFDLWDSKKPYPSHESALSAGIDAALEIFGKEGGK